jgi:hypothetical protein
MSLRRVIALIALAFAVWLWRAAGNELNGSILSPLALFFAALIGLLAIAALIFNLRAFAQQYEESGFGLLSERQGTTLGALVLSAFGAMLLFVGFKGLYIGHMPAIGSGPDLIFAKAPVRYLLAFATWVTGGFALVCLAWLAWRHARAQRASASEA